MTEKADAPLRRNTKELIFEEAAQLFQEKGYASSSMRDLAERTGLSPSSFYNHIRSKEDILKEICFSTAEKFLNGMEDVQKMMSSPEDKLRAIINLHVTIAAEDISSSMVFSDEWRHLSEPLLSQFLKLRNQYELAFQEIIEEGIDTGIFKALDSRIALYTFLNALRWIYFLVKPGKTLDSTALKKDLESLLLNGLSI